MIQQLSLFWFSDFGEKRTEVCIGNEIHSAVSDLFVLLTICRLSRRLKGSFVTSVKEFSAPESN